MTTYTTGPVEKLNPPVDVEVYSACDTCGYVVTDTWCPPGVQHVVRKGVDSVPCGTFKLYARSKGVLSTRRSSK